MNKPIVYPLFSAPVYVNDVGEFEKPDLGALQFSSSVAGNPYGFLSSVDKNVLDRPAFKHVHDIVMHEVHRYARELLAISDSIEFYVTNSWVNIYRRGHFAGPHIHNNSLISGVLYLKATEDSGDIVFHRDMTSLLPFPSALDLDVDRFNIYNCKSWGHRPKTNEICLFPSVVMHSVDPNQSDEERWSLAFNVFVRGDFGGLHKLRIR